MEISGTPVIKGTILSSGGTRNIGFYIKGNPYVTISGSAEYRRLHWH